MESPAPPPHDAAALLERCRVNLAGYDEAIRRGQLCACVVRQDDDHVVAVTTDGDELVGTVEQAVAFLIRKRVIGERLTMPDWRDGDIAPTASAQIAIRLMLRRRLLDGESS